MASKAQITPEEYLQMTFEHEAEYVHGEIVERAMPDHTHGEIAYLIAQALGPVARSHRLYPRFEVRMQVAPDVYRLPEVSVFQGEEPKQSVPTHPPLLVLEILLKYDRRHDKKLKEYRLCGIRNSGVVDPISKRLATYSETGLQYVQTLTLAYYPV